jgi:hypothetical protein
MNIFDFRDQLIGDYASYIKPISSNVQMGSQSLAS